MKSLTVNRIGFPRSKSQEREQYSRSVEENYSIFIYSVPCVLAFLCYSNILHGEFVHDDVFAIKENPDVTRAVVNAGSGWDVWTHDFWGRPMASSDSHKSYRPLTTLFFRLDYFWSQGDPSWFHMVNTFLHACVTCVVTHLCLHTLNSSMLSALLASSLFAVHPVHTEAVSSIVGRADVLAALFFLLSLMAYARCVEMEDNPPRDINHNYQPSCSSQLPAGFSSLLLLMSLLLAVLASLSKETGVTVLGVCFLFDLLKHRHQLLTLLHKGNRSGKISPFFDKTSPLPSMGTRLLALSVTGIVFMVFRMRIMDYQVPHFKPEDNPASFSDSLLTRVLTFHHLLPVNLWLLLCPNLLCYDWQGGSIPLVESILDGRNLMTLAFFALGFAIAWKLWHLFTKEVDEDQHQSINEQTPVFFIPAISIVLMCVPFLPASNLLFTVGFVVAERVLYIPSIGFCILVAHGVCKLCESLPKFKGHILTLTILVTLAFAVKTRDRNPVWASRENLFRSGLETVPTNAKVHFNMANFYKDSGDTLLAIQHYRRAISLHPQHPSYHNNLGTVLTNQSEAEYHFRQALSLYSKHKGALVNLGNLMVTQGNTEGLSLIGQALDVDPEYIEGLLSMSKGLLAYKRFQEAETYIRQVIQLRPDLPHAHIYYGALFHHTGRLEHAVQEYQQALSLNARNTVAMKNAAISLRILRRYDEAERLLKRALSLEEDEEIYSQLGILYTDMGQKLDALFAHREALAMAPNSTAVNLRYVSVVQDLNMESIYY